jgi:hypothetical protein
MNANGIEQVCPEDEAWMDEFSHLIHTVDMFDDDCDYDKEMVEYDERDFEDHDVEEDANEEFDSGVMSEADFAEQLLMAEEGDKASKMRIVWDTQDPNDIGPAWKTEFESGTLNVTGWNDGKFHDLEDWFDGDGAYLGMRNNVHPIFEF